MKQMDAITKIAISPANIKHIVTRNTIELGVHSFGKTESTTEMAGLVVLALPPSFVGVRPLLPMCLLY